jgi:5-methylcytosine-specific restriction endonuclease McrA
MTRGLRSGTESRAEWAKRQPPKACACGCGGNIELTPEHRRRLPRFLPGHNAKTGLERWAEEHRSKHFCSCGCGEAFEPTRQYRRLGFPAYKRGHVLRVAHPRGRCIEDWVKNEQGRHLCECGCGQAIRIWPSYRWEGIPRFRRECLLRRRVGDAHPNWMADRSMVRDGRRGQNFVPAVKRAILERDEYRCRECGSSQNLTIDHIVPVFEGGLGVVENGQTLCADCHKSKTRLDRGRYWHNRRYSRINGDEDANTRSAADVL